MNLMRIKALLYRFLLLSGRDHHRFIDLLYWPTYDIVIWGFTSYWVQRSMGNQEIGLILLACLILWNYMGQVNKEVAWSLLEELWSDNFTNLMATPLQLSEWMMSVMILGLIKGSIIFAYTLGVVKLLYGVNVLSLGWLLIPMLVTLTIFGWALGFFTVSILIYYGQKFQSLTWIVGWFFAPFCGVFYPIAVLPSWMQMIGWALPPTYVFETIRRYSAEQGISVALLLPALGISIAYLCTMICIFYYAFNASKKYGLARLERYE